jgi:hypothetical protein
MITDDHLVVESLHLLDPQDPGAVLSSLPNEILQRMLRFANGYQDGRMVSNYGVLPAHDQVAAAKKWIEHTILQRTSKTV